MSDHDDAIAAGVEAWHAVESPRQNVQRIVTAYHAALPPSIVVDGKVVALAEVYAKYDNQSECVGIAIADARRAIAARQLAEGEA